MARETVAIPKFLAQGREPAVSPDDDTLQQELQMAREKAAQPDDEDTELTRLDAVIAGLTRDVEEATLAIEKADSEYQRLSSAATAAFNLGRQHRIRYNVRSTRLETLRAMRDETVLM